MPDATDQPVEQVEAGNGETQGDAGVAGTGPAVAQATAEAATDTLKASVTTPDLGRLSREITTLAAAGKPADGAITPDGRSLTLASMPEPTLAETLGRRADGPRRPGEVQRVAGPALPTDWGSVRQPVETDAKTGRPLNVFRPQDATRDTTEGVVKNFEARFGKDGAAEVDRHLATIRQNLEQRKDSKGNPLLSSDQVKEQMARISASINDVLDKTGQPGPLSDKDRQSFILSGLAAAADPKRLANQGEHLTCALTAEMKDRLSGINPASVFEEGASAVNNGGFYSAGDGKWNQVAAEGLIADHEARATVDSTGRLIPGAAAGNKRTLFTQVYNQLSGDKMAQDVGGRYVTANADLFARNHYGRSLFLGDPRQGIPPASRTGEGFFKGGSFVSDSPPSTALNTARHMYNMTGREGGLLMSTNMARKLLGDPSSPAVQRLVTTYDPSGGPEALTKAINSIRDRTGSDAVSLVVNAPHLPGGGMSGHGLHALNVGVAANGNFEVSNNWGAGKNHLGADALTFAKLNLAADPIAQQKHAAENPSYATPRDGHYTPDQKLIPGTGRNPNETTDQHQARLKKEQDHQKALDAQKRKEAEEDKVKDKKTLDDQQKKRQEKLETERKAEKELKEGQEYQQFLALARALAKSRQDEINKGKGIVPSIDDLTNQILGTLGVRRR